MAIKLRTEFDSRPGTVHWFNSGADELYHDAAVAHALIRAMDELESGIPVRMLTHELVELVRNRATAILRDQFGIEDSQP